MISFQVSKKKATLIKNPPIKDNFGDFLLELVADLWVNLLGQPELSRSAVVDHFSD